jgi:hypothetical protein
VVIIFDQAEALLVIDGVAYIDAGRNDHLGRLQ